MSESSLVKKLSAVMAAVERIPKRGHNSFHNYDYATEADIVAALRQELAQRNVMVIPSIIGRDREAVGEKGSVLTHLDMRFTFFDGESGEEKTFPWLGAGTDKEDKGAYKAMTGGEKYFLLKTFLIPTGDDPESVEPTQEPQSEVARQLRASLQQQPPKPASPKPTPDPPKAAKPNGTPPTGLLRVQYAKVAKEGVNDKGPWTLYAVRFIGGAEGTTFSKSIFEAAKDAAQSGRLVDAVIVDKKLKEFTPIYETGERDDEPPF